MKGIIGNQKRILILNETQPYKFLVKKPLSSAQVNIL